MMSDNFVYASPEPLRNSHAIELGLENFQVIKRANLTDFHSALHHSIPSKIRIAVPTY
jgi:hypothetical protein